MTLTRMEQEIIMDYRKLCEHGNGHLHVTVENGKCQHEYIQLSKDREQIREMQK